VKYEWSYEDFRSTSGTGGVACNARFLVRNTGNEPLYLIVYTSRDNNAMRSNEWATYQLAPGDNWEGKVNRAIYNDGVVTFTRVDKIIAIRDTPECAATLADDGQAAWEAYAQEIFEIACP
jgi:hypothetical protein